MEMLFKNKNIVVIYKPSGMPSQSDISGDPDAMTLTSSELKKNGDASALWLIHRLDRTVGGLLVFARNKNTAARLSELVGGNGMEKEYVAVVDGKADGGFLSDFIYKDSAKGKAFIAKSERRGVKKAELEYTGIASYNTESGVKTLVRIKLYTGRFHQIRVQFASRGIPITGDGKYGSRDNNAKTPALFAFHLAFNMQGEAVDIKKLPDADKYPWSLFDMEKIK